MQIGLTKNRYPLRSVHNIRIERLWVDVTTQFGEKWRLFFNDLEVHFGLNIESSNHKWLLQFLFLGDINFDCEFFATSWNQHKIRNRGKAARSPAETFGFDMIVSGVRGTIPRSHPNPNPADLDLDDRELEEYGVDWAALADETVIASNLRNNSRSEGTGSWIGRQGPPPTLNEVPVYAPISPLPDHECDRLLLHVAPYLDVFDRDSLTTRWTHALAFARQCNNDF